MIDTTKRAFLCSALFATVIIQATSSGAVTTEESTRDAMHPTPSAHLETVRAVAEARSTRLEIALEGEAAPRWRGQGRRWWIRFPETEIAPGRGTNLYSGGIVNRLGVTALPAERAAILQVDLSVPALCTQIVTRTQGRATFRFAPELTTRMPSVVHKFAPGLFDVEADRADVVALLTSLAHEAGLNLVMAGSVENKVTLKLERVSAQVAIDLLARAAGLTWHQDGSTFLVGKREEIEALYPKAKRQEPAAPPLSLKQEVYTCKHVVAQELVKSLTAMFDTATLKIAVGASGYSPRLDDSSTSAVTGVQSAATHSVGGETGSGARDILLSGEANIVDQALTLVRKLDRRRVQIRIGVRISDIDSEALKELGVRWNWSSYTAHEVPSLSNNSSSSTTPSSATTPQTNGIQFGAFSHDPTYIEATLSALEQNHRSKLLASPTLSLLDGEHGYILIGDRIVYPVLTGYTQAQTPIFSKEEERVGIYLQVAAQTTENGEITLTLYPQVSVVTGFLTINGASYPQISTREQQTTVRVKDGEKIVVGGLIRDEEIKTIERVPILSRLPILGELFTYRKKDRKRSEVVIMITPEILKD